MELACAWVTRRRLVDPALVLQLLRLFEAASVNRGKPWQTDKPWKSQGGSLWSKAFPIEGSIEDHFRRVVEEGEDPARGLNRYAGREGGKYGEKVVFGLRHGSAYKDASEFSCQIVIDPANAGQFCADVGTALDAVWGTATPWERQAHQILFMATEHHYLKIPPGDPSVTRAKELAKRIPKAGSTTLPDVPARLGWINYWAAHICGKMGFPDTSCDGQLLETSRRVPNGAWIVQLTKEPLDLFRTDHGDALVRAYQRFPVVGTSMRRRPASPRGA